MTATKRLSEVPGHSAGWKLRVNGVDMPPRTVWEVASPFGAVRTAVVVDKDGNAVFDRPVYEEAPNVNIVAFGLTEQGQVRIGIIRQPRPHADQPGKPGENGHEPVVFGQIPMGFLERVFGESIESLESVEAGAERETSEETGARVILRVIRPKLPYHNPNPTFVATWSDLAFVEVDLNRIEALRESRNEPIFSAEFISISELLKRIRDGEDSEGALYRMCTANSALMIFFATFPELLRELK